MKKITVKYPNDLEKSLFDISRKFGDKEYRPAAKKVKVNVIKKNVKFKRLEDCKTNDEVSELWTGLNANAYQNRYGVAFNE